MTWNLRVHRINLSRGSHESKRIEHLACDDDVPNDYMQQTICICFLLNSHTILHEIYLRVTQDNEMILTTWNMGKSQPTKHFEQYMIVICPHWQIKKYMQHLIIWIKYVAHVLWMIKTLHMEDEIKNNIILVLKTSIYQVAK